MYLDGKSMAAGVAGSESKNKKELVFDELSQAVALIPDEFSDDSDKLKKIVDLEEGRAPVEVFGDERDAVLTAEIKELFDYIARTRDPEVNTERTGILQEYVDKVLEKNGEDPRWKKWQGKARVIILNKSTEDLDAFVTPEGSIFIAQSTINACKNLDEVVSIVMHEIGHLVNETYKTKTDTSGRSPVGSLGVDWLHEQVADLNTPKMLSEVGLKSTAEADLFHRWSNEYGNQRGSYHLANGLRAAEVMADHFINDVEGSERPYTPTPEALKGRGGLTNLAVAKLLIREGKAGDIKKCVKYLHKTDFKKLINLVFSRDIVVEKEHNNVGLNREIVDKIKEVVVERFSERGLNKRQAELFLFTVTGDWDIYPDFFWGDDTNMDVYLDLLKNSVQYNFSEDHQFLFGSVGKGSYVAAIISIVDNNFPKEYINLYVFSEFVGTAWKQIRKNSQNNALEFEEGRDLSEMRIKLLLLKYIDNFYNVEKDGDLDINQMINLFKQLKKDGYTPEEDIYKDNLIVFKKNPENAKIVADTYRHVFYGEKLDNIGETIKLPDEDGLNKMIHDGMLFSDIFRVINKLVDSNEYRLADENYVRMALGIVLHRAEHILEEIKASPKRIIKETVCVVKEMTKQYPTVFVEHIDKIAMEESDSFDELSIGEALNAINNIYIDISDNHINIITELEFTKKMLAKIEEVRFVSLEEIYQFVRDEYYVNMKVKIGMIMSVNEKDILYSEGINSLLFCEHIRREIEKIIAKTSFQISDYVKLTKFVDEFFPDDLRKKQILHKLNLNYLTDEDIHLYKKMEFFEENYKICGVDGANLIARQITEVKDFRRLASIIENLEHKYISGEEDVAILAGTEIVSSFLVDTEKVLLTSSSDEEISEESSTNLAMAWVRSVMVYGPAKYDSEEERFAISSVGRSSFKSFADIVQALKEMSLEKKFAIALKMLVGEEGILSGKGYKRALFQETLVSELQIKDELVTRTLGEIIFNEKSNIVAYPLSQMIAPLLFSGLKVEKVNIKVIKRLFDKEELKPMLAKIFKKRVFKILSSSTSDLILLGKRYLKDKNSKISRMAQESYASFDRVLDLLNKKIIVPNDVQDEIEDNRESSSEIPSTVESMIRAGETSAVTTRAMQMAVQLMDLPPEIRKRMARSQDSTKAMSDVMFWKNLMSRAEEEPELKKIVESKEFRLGEYIGGGSLFTTFGATVSDGNGGTIEVVIKMLNPNAEEIVGRTYELLKDSLNQVVKNNTGKIQRDARVLLSIVELSKEWCLTDINDKTYEEDDDIFREKVIDSFNQKYSKSGAGVIAPDRYYTSKKIKIEGRHSGDTVNRILQGDQANVSTIKGVISQIKQFFEHQFETPALKDTEGNDIFMFHSDPQLGNYMSDVNRASDNTPFGIIDRAMCLKFGQREVDIFKDLKDGKNIQFMKRFVDHVIKSEGVRGKSEWDNKVIKMKISNHILREMVSQKIRFKEDPIAYLQIVLRDLEEYGAKVPFEYRLMIRNIVAMGKVG